MSENMQTDEEKLKEVIRRRNRVKAFKRIIVIAVVILLLIPNIVSVYSFTRIKSLSQTVDNLAMQLENLKNVEEETVADTTVAAVELEGAEIGVIDRNDTLTDEERFPGKKLVYLTFDDGPSKYTDEVLDILDEFGVKATFFVVKMDDSEDAYRRIVNEGHTLGIHSYTHVYSTIYADKTSFATDVKDMQDFLYDITGQKASFYRFPGGSSNQVSKVDKNELFDVLSEDGLVYYDWNVTSQDATGKGISASRIVENVIAGVEKNDESVVLMHDASGKSSTVEALPIILERLTERDDVVILPITEGTKPVCHVVKK